MSEFPGSGPSCGKHLDEPAMGACERCGDFFCEVCQWFDGLHCLACGAWLKAEEEARRPERSLGRALWTAVTMAFYAALMVLFGGGLLNLTDPGSVHLLGALGFAVVAGFMGSLLMLLFRWVKWRLFGS